MPRWSRPRIAQVSEKQVELLRQSLALDAQSDSSYLALVVSSCLIASFGLVGNSAAVIIGAMIIAPLMLPIRALAFGALEGDVPLFKQASLSILIGSLAGIGLSCLLGRIVDLPEFGSEVLSRTQPNLIDLGIAITAGAIAGCAKVQPKLNDAFAGTAIAVALMPPLCVVGLTLSQGQWNFSQGAFMLYLTNLLGISLAGMLVFVLAGYVPIKVRRTQRVLRIVTGLTAILVIPLAISLGRLLREAQLRLEVKQLLLRETITIGQQVELKRFDIDWTQTPPNILLVAEAEVPPSSRQVYLVEKFIQERLRLSLNLIFRVSQIQTIRSTPDSLEPDQVETPSGESPSPEPLAPAASPVPLEPQSSPVPSPLPRQTTNPASKAPATVDEPSDSSETNSPPPAGEGETGNGVN